MCNKCESAVSEVTAEPSEVTLSPLQIRWNELVFEQRDKDMRQYYLKLYIKGTSLRPSDKYWQDSNLNSKTNRRYPARKADTKAYGGRIARLMSQVKTLVTKELLTEVDMQPMHSYVYELSCISFDTATKVEPAYARVMASYRNGWEMLNIRHLHPYNQPNSNDGHYESYRNLNNVLGTFEPLHMLHISTEDINQIAYYPTLKHYREDRPIRTRLGRYLTKYQQAFGITDADVKSIAEKHASNMQARGGWKVEFKEHDDVAGWLEVYNSRDVSSCMKGMDAVRVYAHEKSTLRLAHVVAGDKIIARCIVRDDPHGDKTGWIRVYPDPNGHAEGRYLRDQLSALGYPNHTNLDGVLLQRLSERGSIVCPYIDYGNNGDQTVGDTFIDGKEYLRVGGGDYNATNTNGYCEDINEYTCDECGDGVGEDDLTYVECDGYSICQCCLDNSYTMAYNGRYQEWCRSGDVVEFNGEYYHMDSLSSHDIYTCDHDGELYHSDDLVTTQDGIYHRDYIGLLDHEDSQGYDVAFKDYVHTLTDGKTCHINDANHYQTELDMAEEAIHLAVA
jgi:hypothetical protein